LHPPLVSGPVFIAFWTNKLTDWSINFKKPTNRPPQQGLQLHAITAQTNRCCLQLAC